MSITMWQESTSFTCSIKTDAYHSYPISSTWTFNETSPLSRPIQRSYPVHSLPSPTLQATQQQQEGHKHHLNQVCPGHHHKIVWTITSTKMMNTQLKWDMYTTTWDLLDSIYIEDFVKNKHLPVSLASQVGYEPAWTRARPSTCQSVQ